MDNYWFLIAPNKTFYQMSIVCACMHDHITCVYASYITVSAFTLMLYREGKLNLIFSLVYICSTINLKIHVDDLLWSYEKLTLSPLMEDILLL